MITALLVVAALAVAPSLVNCPPTVAVEQKLAALPAGWTLRPMTRHIASPA